MVSKFIKKIFKKHVLSFAIFIVLIGIAVTIIFALRPPFYTRGSTEFDPELLSKYGSFIGGLIGPLFSLAGFFLIYKTLATQQKALKHQKMSFELERFEITFFNLLKRQDEIAKNISGVFNSINKNNFKKQSETIQGRDFFYSTYGNLKRLFNTSYDSDYSGIFDEEQTPSELSEQFKDGIDEISPNDLVEKAMSRLLNFDYRITEDIYNKIKEASNTEQVSLIAGCFYSAQLFNILPYYRNLYGLFKYINQTEEFIPDSNKKKSRNSLYISIIKNQMDIVELSLLYYYAFYDKDMRKLLMHLNFFEDDDIKYLLFKKEHNCLQEIKT